MLRKACAPKSRKNLNGLGFKICFFIATYTTRYVLFHEFTILDITYIILALSDPCSTDHGNLPDTPNLVAKAETDDEPPDDPAKVIFSK